MKALSPNLRWMLHHLVGTRLRFGMLFFAQFAGFVLSVLHIGANARQICNLAFWGAVLPFIFLITLRSVAVQLQKLENQSTGGYRS